MINQQMHEDSQRLEVAGEWLLQIKDGTLELDDLAAWLAWYEANPANRSAFEKVQQMFDGLQGMAEVERVAWAAQVLAETERPTPAIRSRWVNFASILSTRWLMNHRGFITGCAVVIAAFVGLAYKELSGQQSISVRTAAYKTERAQHQLLTLPDGSHVRLGAQSQLFLNFTNQARFVVLEGGEAFFEVAKDAHRPFLVQAGAVTVRAVGTEFNVRRIIDRTEVAVAEGVVDVTRGEAMAGAAPVGAADGTHTPISPTIQLSAGQKIVMGDTLVAQAIKTIEPAKVATWQSGRLEFVDEPLRFVSATVNRYGTREIVITDQSIGDLRFTGTVSRDGVNEWLAALPDVLPVQVKAEGSDAVLLSPRSSGAEPNSHGSR